MSFLNENPKLILENIKELLIIGVKERKHSFHTPVFTNINQEGVAVSRIVVLRHFDKKNLILNFHTDFRSPKISGIQNNNYSFFLFYDSKLKIQLRIQSSSFVNNQNLITKKIWDKISLSSRKCYLTKKAPSSNTLIPDDGIPKHLIGIDPSKEESETGYKNFCVIESNITKIDWLYLDSSGHRRLKIEFKKNVPYFNWTIP